jgi:peptidoglycan/LPS O-acetylase OafA/YrhL
VNLFFLLSGFVLTFPYIKNGDDLNLLLFYIKRVFRIYPAFILAIIFCIFLQYFLFDSSKMLLLSPWINEFWKWDLSEICHTEFVNTIILAGIRFNHKLFDPVIGTLRTEMLISFVLPLLIFIALRLHLVFNIIILFILFFIGKDTMGIFYLGIIMAFFRINIIDYVNKKDTYFYSILFFILASILYTSRFSLNFGDTSKMTVFSSILGCAFFLILAMKKGLFNIFLKKRLVQFLGNISYSFYQ